MDEILKKWGLILKAFAITLVLVLVRLVIDISGYDFLNLTTLVTAYIGGAIFTVAIIFTGTLADYKESERLPNDIAVSMITLIQDCGMIRPADAPVAVHLRQRVRSLSQTIVRNMKTNHYPNENIRAEIALINQDLYTLADAGAAPQYLVKVRSELAAIDRLTSRVRVIAETSFIPAAYTIAEIAVAGVVLVLFFVKLDPYYEGMVIFTVITLLLVAIILLIRDMDNPFEFGRLSFADVDYSPLMDLEKDFCE